MRKLENVAVVTHTHTHVYNLKENKKCVKSLFLLVKNER